MTVLYTTALAGAPPRRAVQVASIPHAVRPRGVALETGQVVRSFFQANIFVAMVPDRTRRTPSGRGVRASLRVLHLPEGGGSQMYFLFKRVPTIKPCLITQIHCSDLVLPNLPNSLEFSFLKPSKSPKSSKLYGSLTFRFWVWSW